MSFNTSLISEEQWWSPFPPTLSYWEVILSERWKIYHLSDTITLIKFQSWIQDGGRATHVTHFVQLYPRPLYTASQVRTTSRSWDKGVLTDLCLTLYIPRNSLVLHGVITQETFIEESHESIKTYGKFKIHSYLRGTLKPLIICQQNNLKLLSLQ
jgi:hypothetical protein